MQLRQHSCHLLAPPCAYGAAACQRRHGGDHSGRPARLQSSAAPAGKTSSELGPQMSGRLAAAASALPHLWPLTVSCRSCTVKVCMLSGAKTLLLLSSFKPGVRGLQRPARDQLQLPMQAGLMLMGQTWSRIVPERLWDWSGPGAAAGCDPSARWCSRGGAHRQQWALDAGTACRETQQCQLLSGVNGAQGP